MTLIYFIRHAQPDFSIHEDAVRPLSPQGIKDAVTLSELFRGIAVDQVWSSPYLRSVQTVAGIAHNHNLEVQIHSDLRERKVAEDWIADFGSFAFRQWQDFNYKLRGGESLKEMAERMTAAVEQITEQAEGKTVVIGTHGTAICTYLHRLNPAFGYADFCAMQNQMPWIIRIDTSISDNQWEIVDWNHNKPISEEYAIKIIGKCL